jgi:hypothetical protein
MDLALLVLLSTFGKLNSFLKKLQWGSGLGDPSNGEQDASAELGSQYGPQDDHTIPGLVRRAAGDNT